MLARLARVQVGGEAEGGRSAQLGLERLQERIFLRIAMTRSGGFPHVALRPDNRAISSLFSFNTKAASFLRPRSRVTRFFLSLPLTAASRKHPLSPRQALLHC